MRGTPITFNAMKGPLSTPPRRAAPLDGEDFRE